MMQGCHGNFTSVWDRLACYLWKGFVKLGLLDIYSSTYFVVRNFGNTLAFTVIFFSKCSKFDLDFKTLEKSKELFLFCFLDNCI